MLSRGFSLVGDSQAQRTCLPNFFAADCSLGSQALTKGESNPARPVPRTRYATRHPPGRVVKVICSGSDLARQR